MQNKIFLVSDGLTQSSEAAKDQLTLVIVDPKTALNTIQSLAKQLAGAAVGGQLRSPMRVEISFMGKEMASSLDKPEEPPPTEAPHV